MTLRESLKPFFVTLSKEDKPIALRAVAHFVLFNDYRAYCERIKPLGKDAFALFHGDTRNFVKGSFECRKVWRAVRFSLSQENVPFETASSKFQADLDGMHLFWKCLLESDKEALRAASLSEQYEPLAVEVFSDLIQRLDKYCGKVSYLKLRFLADNDSSLDLDDLRSELLTHGIQAARVYEHTNNLLLIENFCKASIQNHAINLIQHFTSESRACVKNTTVGCGTCVFCLTDKPQRCPNAVADYKITSLSLDGVALSLAGLVPHKAEEHLNYLNMLNVLKEDASPPFIHVVDVIFGSALDEEFEAWLFSTHSVTVDDLSQNPKRLVKLLCHYLDLSPKEVSSQLRTRYESYRKKVA